MVGSAIAIIIIVVLVFIVLRPAATTGSGSGQSAVVGTGSVAPDFILPNLESTAARPLPDVNLYELGKDSHHAVVLNFYASWCPPCRAETPLLASAAKAEATRDPSMQFIGVDVADITSAALSFTRQAGVTYPVGADRSFNTTSRYGLEGEPHTFFINKNGVIVGQVFGQISSSTLDSWLRKLDATR
jgi:cytochrome c biogenesis protein CcmG/thiol:disulfide interchange protein DsbE